MTNAVHAASSRADGRISVSTSQRGTFAQINARDNWPRSRALRHLELQRQVKHLREQWFKARSIHEETSGREETGKVRLLGNFPTWVEISKSTCRVAHAGVGLASARRVWSGQRGRRSHHSRQQLACQAAFVVVNCAALPADLVESELFGHERGASTSALSQKLRKFETADGGSVFLDEIGELPLLLARSAPMRGSGRGQQFRRTGSSSLPEAQLQPRSNTTH